MTDGSSDYSETAEFYELFRRSETVQTPDTSGFFSYLASEGSILDLGAGTGNLAMRLAASGKRVTACEPDNVMRAILADRVARDIRARRLITVSDRTALEIANLEHHDAIVLSGVMQFLTLEDVAALLRESQSILRVGSSILADMVGEAPPTKPTRSDLGARSLGRLHVVCTLERYPPRSGESLTTQRFTYDITEGDRARRVTVTRRRNYHSLDQIRQIADKNGYTLTSLPAETNDLVRMTRVA